MVPTVLVAGLFSVGLTLPFALPFSATPRDVSILALMGFVQLGLGCLLMTLAARRLKAAEVGLLTLLETILGPLWVWLGVGERPSDLALAGGAVVVGALGANEILGRKRGRDAPAPPLRAPASPGIAPETDRG
jgi:drug/metabolite transporter (DMT)-like permease